MDPAAKSSKPGAAGSVAMSVAADLQGLRDGSSADRGPESRFARAYREAGVKLVNGLCNAMLGLISQFEGRARFKHFDNENH